MNSKRGRPGSVDLDPEDSLTMSAILGIPNGESEACVNFQSTRPIAHAPSLPPHLSLVACKAKRDHSGSPSPHLPMSQSPHPSVLLFPTFSSRQEPPKAIGKCLFSQLSACFRGGATRSLPYLSCSPAPHRTGQAAFPHPAPRFAIQ